MPTLPTLCINGKTRLFLNVSVRLIGISSGGSRISELARGKLQLIRSPVNSKFHLIRSFFEIIATVNSNTVNLKFHQFEVNLIGV